MTNLRKIGSEKINASKPNKASMYRPFSITWKENFVFSTSFLHIWTFKQGIWIHRLYSAQIVSPSSTLLYFLNDTRLPSKIDCKPEKVICDVMNTHATPSSASLERYISRIPYVLIVQKRLGRDLAGKYQKKISYYAYLINCSILNSFTQ